jgi:hypothetical protein
VCRYNIHFMLMRNYSVLFSVIFRRLWPCEDSCKSCKQPLWAADNPQKGTNVPKKGTNSVQGHSADC